ncbi:MAG: glycoside hydrolase family 25 protein [Prevotellaceae bacterium]|nr:glycoside hydrolase family 25 protein [Prevotellaceae bacterium]
MTKKHIHTHHYFFHKRPSRAFMLGALIVTIIYVFLFYYFFVGPSSFRWKAIFSDVHYPDGYTIHGIDISHYQGKIDWDVLKENAEINNTPLRFIMVKATEGSNRLDERFEDNFKQALENGFIRGAYHFWSTKTSARQQANFFIKNVQLEEGDLPPVLDVEKKGDKVNVKEFRENIKTWLDIVEDHYDVAPIIYTSYKFKVDYLYGEEFDRYPYWIAHYYVDTLQYKGEWKFWQHTDAGRLPGIKGYVDFDVYNGSYYDLRKLTIGSREAYSD